jgi:hypothetical protein
MYDKSDGKDKNDLGKDNQAKHGDGSWKQINLQIERQKE